MRPTTSVPPAPTGLVGRRLASIGFAMVMLGALLTFRPVGSPAQAAPGAAVQVTWSSENGEYQLSQRPEATLGSTPGPSDVTINVDPQARHQTVFGNGGVLESSSVYNIAHLSPAKRDQIMSQLFDPATGNGYNVVRLAMGCPDMCSHSFHTYDDRPAGETDTSLTHFSIQQDIDDGIVDLARQARRLNPDVRFYLSMWSAPAWMKTNGSLINGGDVKPEYYPVLARYQRKAIQAYQAQGIPIHAMTPQNEPRVVMPYPTGQWSGTQMRDYIKDHLGPELTRAGVGTQIWVGDDNPPRLKDFVPAILDDPQAAQYVRGVAIHDYSNDDPTVLSEFSLRYPGFPLHLTERSYYGINGEVHRVSGDRQGGLRRLIDFYRNGLTSWTYWITFLDTTGEPNTGPLDASCCSVPFTAEPGRLDQYRTQRDHFLYGQIARFVQHGAERIGSDQTSTEVSNVVFRNPDHGMAAIVANGASQTKRVNIVTPDGVITADLPAMTVGTYRWRSTAVPDDPRVGTFRLVEQDRPDRALQITGDRYLHWDDAFDVVSSPAAWDLLAQRWSISSAGGGYYRLTNMARPGMVLHTTGETYPAHPDAWSVAATRSDLQWDEQLWRIEASGNGSYRLTNKHRGTVLQSTGETYETYPDVRQVASAPASWGLAEQRWRLVAG